MDGKEREQGRRVPGASGRPVGRVDAEAAKAGREPVPSNLRAARSATKRRLQGPGEPRSGPTGPRRA
jgi:hypothetical protein